MIGRDTLRNLHQILVPQKRAIGVKGHGFDGHLTSSRVYPRQPSGL
jgi:hypothetical protein